MIFSVGCAGREVGWTEAVVGAGGAVVGAVVAPAAGAVVAGGAVVDDGAAAEVGAGASVAESPPQATANRSITGRVRVPSSFRKFPSMVSSMFSFGF